jgi:DNA-binding CsgD family transcriptional regulator
MSAYSVGAKPRRPALDMSRIEELTEEEKQVLVLMCRGHTTKVVARELGISSEMTHSTLDDVRKQIIASMDQVTAAGPVRRWHGRPIDWVYRNHRVAVGIVDMLENIARSLGETRVKLFADEDTPGGTPLVLQPTNPRAARLTVFVNWLSDEVQLYPGEHGRVETWPSRRQSAEAFIASIRTYVDAVISGGFRATFPRKREQDPFAPTQLEFLVDGRWRRSRDFFFTPLRQHAWITRAYEPY